MASFLLLACLAASTIASGHAWTPNPSVRYTPWSDLSDEQRASAALVRGLAYNETTWNNPGTNEVEGQAWSNMRTRERNGARSLGFGEDSWNCWINHYNAYGWSDLGGALKGHFEILGWTEETWGNSDKPDAWSKKFCELTQPQQAAAVELCYLEETWDGVPLTEWDMYEAPCLAGATSAPTSSPSANPTSPPTDVPTPATSEPTSSPSANPTDPPTDVPTPATSAPTSSPSANPTDPPTDAPTPATSAPTSRPSANPTTPPTDVLTPAKTTPSSTAPTSAPTSSPSANPTDPPTDAPTPATSAPTSSPSANPTDPPTDVPTPATSVPTSSPSANPTPPPTDVPTPAPTTAPTDALVPTKIPTVPPSYYPTFDPTTEWIEGDGDCTTPYYSFDWVDLPPNIRNAAEGVGYTETVWRDQWFPDEYEDTDWDDLDDSEKDAFSLIGYNRGSWNKFYYYFWYEDLPERVKLAAEKLGWSEDIWCEGGDSTTGVDDKWWDDLTLEEQQALKVFGYDCYTWDNS